MTEFAPPDVLAGVAEEQEEAMAAEETTDRLQVHEEKEEEIAHGWIGRGYRARPHRRNSADFSAAVETAAFLHACGLCNRRLGPGRDTFMYRYVADFPRKIQYHCFFLPSYSLRYHDKNLGSDDIIHTEVLICSFCVQRGRGVLQPGVQAAAHSARGVEGQVRARGAGRGGHGGHGGAGDRQLRRPAQRRRHARRGMRLPQVYSYVHRYEYVMTIPLPS